MFLISPNHCAKHILPPEFILALAQLYLEVAHFCVNNGLLIRLWLCLTSTLHAMTNCVRRWLISYFVVEVSGTSGCETVINTSKNATTLKSINNLQKMNQRWPGGDIRHLTYSSESTLNWSYYVFLSFFCNIYTVTARDADVNHAPVIPVIHNLRLQSALNTQFLTVFTPQL